MELIKGANLALRFLLEIGVLAALGYWGFQVGSGWTKVLLGVGAPLLAAVVWGVFLAPASSTRLSEPPRLILEIVVFASAAAALAATGHTALALAFALVAAVNRTLISVWGQ